MPHLTHIPVELHMTPTPANHPPAPNQDAEALLQLTG